MTTIIYSCLVGGYDKPPRVLEPEPDARYLLFTDLDEVPHPWERIPMPMRPRGASVRAWSRMPKIQPHIHLPDHDVSVWIDANLTLLKPVGALARHWAAQFPISAPAHHKRSCVYEEIEGCRKWGLEFGNRCDALLARLDQMKYPRDNGLLENCFIVRGNHEETAEICAFWWELYRNWSDRDQLTLMPALWVKCVTHGTIPFHPHSNEYYHQGKHLLPREVCEVKREARIPKVRVVSGYRKPKPKLHTDPPAVLSWPKRGDPAPLDQGQWAIVTYVAGGDYAELLKRHLPSWKRSGANCLHVYTDLPTASLFPGAHVLETHETPAAKGPETWARKIDCLEHSAGFGTYSRLLWLDADCYVTRHLGELWSLMGSANVGLARMFHRNPRCRPTGQAGVIALQIDNRMDTFFDLWRTAMDGINDPLAEQIGLSKVCQMAFDGLMTFTAVPLSEYRWNSEDNQRKDLWLRTLEQYRPSILHFTTGWWRNLDYWRQAIEAATSKPTIA